MSKNISFVIYGIKIVNVSTYYITKERLDVYRQTGMLL